MEEAAKEEKGRLAAEIAASTERCVWSDTGDRPPGNGIW